MLELWYVVLQITFCLTSVLLFEKIYLNNFKKIIL